MKKEALSALVASLLAGCKSADNATEVNYNQSTAFLPDGSLSAADNATLKQFQLEKLLAELAEKPAPKEKRGPSAMCYEMSAPSDRIEYVCPQCGEKTIYSASVAKINDVDFASITREDLIAFESEWQVMHDLQSLQYNRNRLENLRKLGIDASLDERAFCGVCKTTAEFPDEKLALYLNVRLNGKTSAARLYDNDWIKLFAFLNGKDEWVTDPIGGSTRPLKPEIPRIRELLGLDEKATEEKSAPDSTEENAK